MNTLLDYCTTDHQRNIIQAYIEHGSASAAANHLKLDGGNCRSVVRAIKNKASLAGYAPEHDMQHTAPETHFVKGTSTLYKEGEPVLQWVKTDKRAADQYAAMAESIEALKQEVPVASVSKLKPKCYDDLLTAYTVTDYHMGMMAWGEETRGEDWDLSIAESTLIGWFEQAIKQSPDSKIGLIAQIGDFLHWDGMEAVTPTHGHVLDADTRFQKLIRSTIKCFITIVDMMLEKHEQVHIINATGNHDLASSAWLREMFSLYYSNTDRVTVDNSADIYYCYEWGKTSLFYHHGHKRGVGNVSAVFAAKFRDVFGRTEFSYGHLGHRHSVDRKEDSLMIIEQHQTLAASDAHASHGGWLSSRSAQSITYHKNYGEVGRVRITPDMLQS